MKKLYKNFSLLIIFLISVVSINAQVEVMIQPCDFSDVMNPKFSILSDSIPTIIAKKGTDVKFVLKRDGFYYIASKIEAFNYHLWIKAEDGQGALPRIHLMQDPSTSAWAENPTIITQKDVTIQNIHFDFSKIGYEKQYATACLFFGGEGSVVKLKGCYIDRDRQAAFRLNAANMKAYINDCRFGNLGEPNQCNGLGRFIECRNFAVDTVRVQNSTFYGAGDRIFRNVGGHINYLEMDHVTILDHMGRHGGIDINTALKVKITNTICRNPQILGTGTPEHADECPEFTLGGNDNLYWVMLANPYLGYVDPQVEIHNNNWFSEQKVIDELTALPAVSYDATIFYKVAEDMNPYLESLLGESVNDAFMTPEILEFTNVPVWNEKYVKWANKAHTKGDMNNGLSDDAGKTVIILDTSVFIQNYDVSYSTSSMSYTAGTGGFPLGDLNAFPAKKAEWEAWDGTSGIKAQKANKSNINGLTSYPNPFISGTNMKFEMVKDGDVSLMVYNIQGELVNVLVNQEQSAGIYKITWNGTDGAGSELPGGIYLAVLKVGGMTNVTRIVKF